MKKKGYNITLGIFIGLIAGVIVGIIMPEWANTALSVVASIYMSALKMMIFPLVFTSLVMGIIGIGDYWGLHVWLFRMKGRSICGNLCDTIFLSNFYFYY